MHRYASACVCTEYIDILHSIRTYSSVQEHLAPEALFEWVPRRVGQVHLIIPGGPGGVRVPGAPLPGHTASQGPTRIRASTKFQFGIGAFTRPLTWHQGFDTAPTSASRLGQRLCKNSDAELKLRQSPDASWAPWDAVCPGRGTPGTRTPPGPPGIIKRTCPTRRGTHSNKASGDECSCTTTNIGSDVLRLRRVMCATKEINTYQESLQKGPKNMTPILRQFCAKTDANFVPFLRQN